MYGVGFDSVFSCEEVMYGKICVFARERSERVFENDVCLRAITVEEGDVCVGGGVEEGANHADAGGDTNPTRDENKMWRTGFIGIEKAIGGGGSEGFSYFARKDGVRKCTHFFYGEGEEFIVGCATDTVTFALSGLEAREAHGEVLPCNEMWLFPLGTQKECGHEWRLFFFLYNRPGDTRWHGVFRNQGLLRGAPGARVPSSGICGREAHPNAQGLLLG